MNVKRILILLLCGFALAACGLNPAPPPAPPTNPNSPTVLVPFTPSTQELELPTLLPTVTIPPTVVPVTVTPILVTVTPSPTPPRSNACAEYGDTGGESDAVTERCADSVYHGATRGTRYAQARSRGNVFCDV